MIQRRQFSYRHLNMIVCGDGRGRVVYNAFKIVPQTSGDQCVVTLLQHGEVLARGVGKDLNLAADQVCQQVMAEAGDGITHALLPFVFGGRGNRRHGRW